MLGSVGLTVFHHTFSLSDYQVYYLSTQNELKDFVEITPFATVIMISRSMVNDAITDRMLKNLGHKDVQISTVFISTWPPFPKCRNARAN